MSKIIVTQRNSPFAGPKRHPCLERFSIVIFFYSFFVGEFQSFSKQFRIFEKLSMSIDEGRGDTIHISQVVLQDEFLDIKWKMIMD